MLRLDHIIIAVPDLEDAQQAYTAQGFTVLPGGQHANQATHNALIVLADGSYIELIAPTGQPPQNASADFRLLTQHGAGLVGFALAVDHLAAWVASRPAGRFEVHAGGRQRPDGIMLAWQAAFLVGQGLSPFFIEDVTPRSLRVPDSLAAITHANTAQGITRLTLPWPATEFDHHWAELARLLGIPADTPPGTLPLAGCTLHGVAVANLDLLRSTALGAAPLAAGLQVADVALARSLLAANAHGLEVALPDKT